MKECYIGQPGGNAVVMTLFEVYNSDSELTPDTIKRSNDAFPHGQLRKNIGRRWKGEDADDIRSSCYSIASPTIPKLSIEGLPAIKTGVAGLPGSSPKPAGKALKSQKTMKMDVTEIDEEDGHKVVITTKQYPKGYVPLTEAQQASAAAIEKLGSPLKKKDSPFGPISFELSLSSDSESVDISAPVCVL